MLRKPTPMQHELEMVTLESLVPADHLLRKIAGAIDFEFIRPRVAHLYCPDNGRPALDPVTLFKLLFIGYLFGIRSERQLMREVQVNVAYRWFLDLRLTDRVPDASTLSANRRRRFEGSTIYQEIFDEIVLQAMGRGMVEGRVLYTDSTHLKANANKNKFDVVQVEQRPAEYLAALEQAVEDDRAAHGKKPLPPKDDDAAPSTEKKVSRTDPDSGYMTREGKPQGFFYLDHRTVDAKHNIITDSHVTAIVHDSQPYLGRLDRQRARFGFDVQWAGLDAGYFTPLVCQGLEERGILGVMGYRRPNHHEGYFYKRQYAYDPAIDSYRCPEGQVLAYKTTNRVGYREYHSDAAACRGCAQREQCTRSANHKKVVVRHVWEDAKERVDARRLSPEGKRIYARRKETVERSFADAKELHGQRYARMRGIAKVREQCLLAAAAQNMKKIALVLARLLKPLSALPARCHALQRRLRTRVACTARVRVVPAYVG